MLLLLGQQDQIIVRRWLLVEFGLLLIADKVLAELNLSLAAGLLGFSIGEHVCGVVGAHTQELIEFIL